MLKCDPQPRSVIYSTQKCKENTLTYCQTENSAYFCAEKKLFKFLVMIDTIDYELKRMKKMSVGIVSSNMIVVPKGMSYVNAFRALWENAKPDAEVTAYKISRILAESEVLTVKNVVQAIEMRAMSIQILKGKQSVYMIGGRWINVNFLTFPNLDVTMYNSLYGKNAAEKTLLKYNVIPSEQRFDKNDNCHFLGIRAAL